MFAKSVIPCQDTKTPRTVDLDRVRAGRFDDIASTTSGARLPDKRLPLIPGEIVLGWRESRSEVATASGLTTALNVPQPRDCVNEPPSRYGVGRRARVDRPGDRAAYTAGPTCTPQRGRVRRLPYGPSVREEMRAGEARSVRAGRGRAADIPRPGAAVMGRAASSDGPYCRPSRYTPPSLMSGLCARSHSQNGHQGRGAPTRQRSHRDVPKER